MLKAVFGLLLVVMLPVLASAALQAGSDISGAPFEVYTAQHRAIGFDMDLIQAIGAKIGRPIGVVNHPFDDLMPSVRRGTFDLAIAAISDTRAREKLVDFVDYFIAGGGLMVPSANPHHVFFLSGLCGYAVAVELGTAYEAALNAQSAQCKQVGLAPIHVRTYPNDNAAYAAFASGTSDAYITDYPVGVYRVKHGGSAFAMVGSQFQVVPYGIAVKKGNALRSDIAAGLRAVVADGTYDRLLKAWSLQAGALRSVPINAGTLFEK